MSGRAWLVRPGWVRRFLAGLLSHHVAGSRLDATGVGVGAGWGFVARGFFGFGVAKLITGQEEWKAEDVVVYAIGNKGREILERKGYTVKESYPEVIEEPTYAEAMLLSDKLLTSFAAGEIGEIYLAYTHFKNTVSHEPKLLKLLPVEYDAEAGASTEGADALMNFEPEDVEALDMIIPKYISSLIYGALMEAAASENGARMQAMDNATSNAEDMISDLSLKYNRARQGSITQELTEIIAGAEAL
jgi:F-type H+-transporting ATPase subunit gamma